MQCWEQFSPGFNLYRQYVQENRFDFFFPIVFQQKCISILPYASHNTYLRKHTMFKKITLRQLVHMYSGDIGSPAMIQTNCSEAHIQLADTSNCQGTSLIPCCHGLYGLGSLLHETSVNADSQNFDPLQQNFQKTWNMMLT